MTNTKRAAIVGAMLGVFFVGCLWAAAGIGFYIGKAQGLTYAQEHPICK